MPITQIRRQRGKVCRKMLSEPGGIGAGPLCREQRGVAARAGGARRSEAALGLGSGITAGFSFWLWLFSNFVLSSQHKWKRRSQPAGMLGGNQ